MSRDYKDRVKFDSYSKKRRRNKNLAILFWRWLFLAGLLFAFVFFVNILRKIIPELIYPKTAIQTQQQDKTTVNLEKKPVLSANNSDPKPDQAPLVEEEPRYDFYTILPQAETEVPDYEIKTRVREEMVGKTKTAKYVIQAGSFRVANEAENLRSKLALLGIQSYIEKTKMGNVIWHRVKIGPYNNPSSVETLKDLLQKNGIGVVVTESAP